MGSPPGFFITGLQFFHKTIKQKTAGWRFARGFVTPALRPAFCGFAAMPRRKAFQMPQAAFERGSNTSCNSKNKRPPDGGLLFLVEHRGFEPLTPTLPVLCAPNCANAPYVRLGKRIWRALRDLNPRPTESESGTLSGLS